MIFPLPPRTDGMFNRKSKKSGKSFLRHVSLGIPTNIAAGPLGFRAELDIGPKGERGYDFEGDRHDLTVMPDEDDVIASQIVFNDKEGQGQRPPVPGPSTSGAVVGGDEHDIGHISEFFRSLPSRPMFTRISKIYPSGENTGDTREKEGRLAEVSKGACQSSLSLTFF